MSSQRLHRGMGWYLGVSFFLLFNASVMLLYYFLGLLFLFVSENSESMPWAKLVIVLLL